VYRSERNGGGRLYFKPVSYFWRRSLPAARSAAELGSYHIRSKRSDAFLAV
jgi:hypothetical protein